jgi:outer membrane protein assembly factor BamD
MSNKIYLLIILSIIIASCSGGDGKLDSPEKVYTKAMDYYADEDYLDAKKYFDIIKLQYPASKYAEFAQFYLAETEFAEGKYVMSAFNYNTLRRSYPSSKFAGESMFKAALCYYRLSPAYDRDQEYTHKAITMFKEIQYLNPSDSLTILSGTYIDTLRTKLANRSYFTAELYQKLSTPKSSVTYYEDVIDNYDDTKYFEPAYFGKIKTLVKLKKYDEALGLIDLYKRLFPSGDNLINLVEIEDKARRGRKNLAND